MINLCQNHLSGIAVFLRKGGFKALLCSGYGIFTGIIIYICVNDPHS